jgi:hypothetical protein
MTKVISNADQIIRRLETSDEERLDILDKQIDEDGEDVNQILEWTQRYVRIQTQHWTCLRCNEGPCTEEGHRKAYKAGTEPTGIPIRLNFEICNKGSCDATHAHAHQCGPGRQIQATLDLNQAIQWSWGSEAMQKQFDEQRAIQADAEADDEISSLDLGPPTNQAEIDYDDQYDDGTTIVEETERKKVIRTRQWLAKVVHASKMRAGGTAHAQVLLSRELRTRRNDQMRVMEMQQQKMQRKGGTVPCPPAMSRPQNEDDTNDSS